MDGGNKYEFAALPLFDHLARGNLADEKGAVKIHTHNLVSFVVGDIKERLLDFEAGVGDGDIEPAKFFDGFLDHALDFVPVVNFCCNRNRCTTLFRDFFQCVVARVLPPRWKLTTTFAPSAAKRTAIAWPMPLPAPVMIATLLFNRIAKLPEGLLLANRSGWGKSQMKAGKKSRAPRSKRQGNTKQEDPSTKIQIPKKHQIPKFQIPSPGKVTVYRSSRIFLWALVKGSACKSRRRIQRL